MNELKLLLKGILAGLAISAPVGPVNVLCIKRTLARGWTAGVISGLGAAAADTIYGGIAGFSISFIIGFLVREEFWIRLFGGILLIGIGILYYYRRPESLEKERRNESEKSEYVSAFLLTLTNPTTVLSFLAVLAGLGMGQHREWWLTLFLVLAVPSYGRFDEPIWRLRPELLPQTLIVGVAYLALAFYLRVDPSGEQGQIRRQLRRRHDGDAFEARPGLGRGWRCRRQRRIGGQHAAVQVL